MIRATIAGLLAAGAAQAADVERGRALAERWCAACHVIGEGQPGGDAGPPLAMLTGDVAWSDPALTAWLTEPHDPMPDLGLNPPEIRDIVAFVRSLNR
jgi:mono/diheme cytochrome c family protein